MIRLTDQLADDGAQFFRCGTFFRHFRVFRSAADLCCIVEIGLSPAGRNAAHPDTIGAQFGVKTVAELGKSGFGCGIDTPCGPRIKSADAGNIDDHAAAPFAHHLRRTATAQNRSGQVDIDGPDDLLIALFRHRCDLPARPGIVHQHVRTARRGKDPVPIIRIGHIRHQIIHAQFCRRRLQFRLIPSGDPHLRSSGFQHLCDALAVSIRTACHKDLCTRNFHFLFLSER